MEFDWSEERDGFPADKLDRAKYAEFLTNFLSSMNKESYVMNLNAEWGAGKTFFLQRWYHSIKNEYPSVYIDAWKHDFSDDPLLAVIASITDYLKENTKESASDKAQTVLKSGWRFTKNVAPELMRGITKKISGVDISNFGDDENSSIDNLKYDPESTNGVEDFSLFAGKVFQVALADHSEKTNEIDVFKLAIKGWLDELIEQTDDLKLPMFVFIDELDRCRPTYAIELLETVKHLFEIKGIIFVIATDTNQLQHSIKAVYGEGFDSSRYLYRFFNRSFSLKKPDVLEFIKTQKIFNQHLSKGLLFTCDGNLIFTEGSLAKSLAAMCESFDFDLRTVQQWLDQLWGCYNNEGIQNKYAWFVTALLLGMKLSDPILYREITTTYIGETYLRRPNKEKYDFKFLNRSTSNKEIVISITPKHITQIPGDRPHISSPFDGTKIYKRSYDSDMSFLQMIYNYLSVPPTDTKFARDTFEGVENKNPVIELTMHYCEHEHSATKQGYIDLVEMASDLT